MITLIAETNNIKIIRENEEKYSETKSNTFLYEVSPRLMPYTYARTHYLIPVPWSYYIISENLSVSNFSYNPGRYHHSYSSKINQIFFHGTKANSAQMSLMDAPMSNMSLDGQLCGASYNKIFFDSSPTQLDTYDKLGIFNNSYVSFGYEAGNNDYPLVLKTIGTHNKVPLVRDLVTKWNVSNWPSFFKKWSKLKCQPEEFWPSSPQDVADIFASIEINNNYEKPLIERDPERSVYSIDTICESNYMVKVNSVLLED